MSTITYMDKDGTFKTKLVISYHGHFTTSFGDQVYQFRIGRHAIDITSPEGSHIDLGEAKNRAIDEYNTIMERA